MVLEKHDRKIDQFLGGNRIKSIYLIIEHEFNQDKRKAFRSKGTPCVEA